MWYSNDIDQACLHMNMTQEECWYLGICLCWSGNKRKWSKISKQWMGNNDIRKPKFFSEDDFKVMEGTDAKNKVEDWQGNYNT